MTNFKVVKLGTIEKSLCFAAAMAFRSPWYSIDLIYDTFIWGDKISLFWKFNFVQSNCFIKCSNIAFSKLSTFIVKKSIMIYRHLFKVFWILYIAATVSTLLEFFKCIAIELLLNLYFNDLIPSYWFFLLLLCNI